MGIPIANAVQGAASGAASGLGGLMTDFLGKMGFDNIGDLLGSDMFKNMVQGGSALWQAGNAKDALNFQKGAYNDARADQNILMDDYQEDRDRNKNLDFASVG